VLRHQEWPRKLLAILHHRRQLLGVQHRLPRVHGLQVCAHPRFGTFHMPAICSPGRHSGTRACAHAVAFMCRPPAGICDSEGGSVRPTGSPTHSGGDLD
jgi:hypothetical protein